MKFPWSKPRATWEFCRYCGFKMIHSAYNMTDYFDRTTGVPMVEVKPLWVCSQYRETPDFDPRKGTRHDLRYNGDNYGIPAEQAKMA